MSTFLSVSRLVIRAYLGLAMAALFIMMLSIVVDVFMRYAFKAPIIGTFDVVEICLVVAVFFGMGAAISGFHEIVIDLIDQVVPQNVVRTLCRVAGLLSVAILVFIFLSMLTPAMQAYQYGEMRLELRIPVWIVWVIALVGMCGGLLASIMNVLEPPLTTKATPPDPIDAS